jgi:hypothetical protein
MTAVESKAKLMRDSRRPIMQNAEMPRKVWMKYVWIFNDSEDDWDVDDDAEMPDPDDIAAAMKAAAQDLFLRLDLRADQWEGVVDFNDPYLNTSRLALVRVITLGGALIGTVQDQGDTDSPSEVFLLLTQNTGKLPVESELRTALRFLSDSDMARVLWAVTDRPEPHGSMPHLIELILKVAYPKGTIGMPYVVRWVLIEAMLKLATQSGRRC